MNKFTKGFTLIELLVVIAVLGVLAAGVFTAINPLKRIQQANDAKIKNDIGQIAQVFQGEFTLTQSYPSSVGAVSGPNKDFKTEPLLPGGGRYTVTGTATDVTVNAKLTETDQGFWCWESVTGKTGRVTAAPAVTATSCGTFQ